MNTLDNSDFSTDFTSIPNSDNSKSRVHIKDKSETLRRSKLSPKISIILPVYNGEKYLEKAIDSIIYQSYKNWELIIINDGSTDKTEQIIYKYANNRIKYHKNKTNLGLIATLNKAIDLCTGEYIARMDADDISDNKRLKKQVDFLDNHPDVSLCGTNATLIDGDENKKGNIINFSSNDYLQINLLFTVPFVHPSVMIRSSLLKELKYREEYKHIEDFDLWCRIAVKSKLHNLPQKLLKYRWHTANISIINYEEQEILKKEILKRQLKSILDLNCTDDELFLHQISFAKKEINDNKFTNFGELSEWFKKLLNANANQKYYNQKKFIAFLWSRWIVLCVSQKKYGKIMKPGFVPFSMYILLQTLKLLKVLSKK